MQREQVIIVIISNPTPVNAEKAPGRPLLTTFKYTLQGMYSTIIDHTDRHAGTLAARVYTTVVKSAAGPTHGPRSQGSAAYATAHNTQLE